MKLSKEEAKEAWLARNPDGMTQEDLARVTKLRLQVTWN